MHPERDGAVAEIFEGQLLVHGVDSAHLLSSSTNTAGTFQSCARLSASWNVPMFVAPSPKNASATRGSPRSWKASAAPVIAGRPAADDRVRADVPALDVVQVHRAAVAVRAAFALAVQLRHHLVRVRALRERVPVRAVRGGDHVAVLERAADADGARLLADRHVQEAGELARAEALLDLLLEAADEEHLAQELAQLLLREVPLPLPRPSAIPAEFMLRLVSLVEQWREIEREPPGGLERRAPTADRTRRSEAARATAAARPVEPPAGAATRELFYVARRGAGFGAGARRASS